MLDVQSAVVFIAGYIDGDIEKGIDNSIERMLEVARLAKEAPLFPVTKLAKRLSKHIDVYGSHSRFDELTERVDRMVAKRSGEAAAAASCRERAVRLVQVGQILRAIDQLHKAKVDWFSEETLRDSLLTILTIGHWYSHLGLDFAAKYYALSSASLAFNASNDSLKDIVPAAIGYAANIDYKIGAWAGMLTLVETNLGVLAMHSDSDLYFPDEHDRIIGHLALMLVAAERLAPHIAPKLVALFQGWHLDEDVEELARLARRTWDGQPVASLWEAIESQLAGAPFSDVGEFRIAQWSALGVTWVLEWKNDAATTAAAEGFAAVLQIFLADLATEELCLLRTEIRIRIEFTEVEKPSVVRRPSNVETVWDLRLPFALPKGGKGLRDSQRMAIGVAGAILREHSLLSDEDFGSALSRSFEKGLQMKVFVGKPYEQLFHEILDFEFLGDLHHVQGTSPGADREFPVAPPYQELAWRESIGPGYNGRAALERIQQRYEGALPPVRLTLRRLNADSTFKDAVFQLRAEGWLDWHLLMTVANIAINERLQGQLRLATRHDQLSMNRLANRAMRRPEEESDSPLPLSLFSEQGLRQQLNISVLSLLDSFGLEIRQETPNFEAVKELLERRFNILTDDVPHDDPFSVFD